MASLSQCGQLCLQHKENKGAKIQWHASLGGSGAINNIDMKPYVALSYFYLLDSARSQLKGAYGPIQKVFSALSIALHIKQFKI